MKVLIQGKEYKVKHDYLHRGQNPRLVLEDRIDGHLTSVQFNSMYEYRNLKLTGKEVFKGYLITDKATEIEFQIIED